METQNSGGHVPLKNIQSLTDSLARLNQRFNDRFIPEKTAWGKAYIDGKFEVILYQEGATPDQPCWCARIKANTTVTNAPTPSGEAIQISNFADGYSRDEVIMLVVVVKLGNGPEIKVPSTIRLYLLENKSTSISVGRLYRGVTGSSYKVFPKFCIREGDVSPPPCWVDLLNISGCKYVQATPEVMQHITNDDGKMLWNWLLGNIAHIGKNNLTITRHGVYCPEFNSVKISGKAVDVFDNVVDVAVGPLNF